MRLRIPLVAARFLPAQARATSDLIARVSAMVQRVDELTVEQSTYQFYEYCQSLCPSQYRRALEEWYETYSGRALDLDNPKTFCEKLQWLKLYDSTPLKTRLADKYLVRQWVENRIGVRYLIPILGVWDSFTDIDFAALPNQFILKCTHSSGFNEIIRDKASMDLLSVRARFDQWLHINYAYWQGFELHYSDIRPRILAERYIINGHGELNDYKVWCFNGVPHFIQYLNHEDDVRHASIFDTNWVLQPFSLNRPRHIDAIGRPAALPELLRCAAVLSQGLTFVRVDFYITEGGDLKFGEMTFSPRSGLMFFDPPIFDRVVGDLIDLSSAGH